jgi:hypothetical protein
MGAHASVRGRVRLRVRVRGRVRVRVRVPACMRFHLLHANDSTITLRCRNIDSEKPQIHHEFCHAFLPYLGREIT